MSTYRLQIRESLDLDDAARLVDYLDALGITELYSSPLLACTPGSAHGYDVTDPTRLDPARSGEAGLRRLAARLDETGMGLLLDIVPNHLAADHRNPWWWDVLRHGPDSDHAGVFDLDWEPGPGGRPRIVLPVLAENADEQDLELVEADGEPAIAYGERRFPVRPGTGEGGIPDVLARQHYRLVGWRSGDPGYRRFFDITGLVGVRVEDPEVFAATHATVLRLVDQGLVDGLRLDHPDGLRDPAAYLRRLRRAVGGDVRVVVEKILEPGERLPGSWPVQGTVGYGFCRLVTGLLVDPSAEAALTGLWARRAGRHRDVHEEVRLAKHTVLRDLLGPERRRLTRLVTEVARSARPGEGPPEEVVARVVTALLAAFPVYRTYVAPDSHDPPRPGDRRVIAAAVAAARVALHREVAGGDGSDGDGAGGDGGGGSGGAGSGRDGRTVHDDVLDLIRDVLLRERRPPGADDLVALLQQTTGPVMAKGKEDTAFYRHLRLTALNEVGGDPATVGVAPAAFHAANRERGRRWPRAMLTTSTHDSKRSEDVRARLAVLSEIPDRWVRAVEEWEAACAPLRDGPGPAPPMEYLAWQTALGAWPIDGDRLAAYLVKAAREAKRRTSWRDPDPAVEDALEHYAHGLVDHAPFLAPLRELLDVVVPTGRINSLAQTLLRCTSPGVPDLYQGQELWDLSLVDPDNRRPVDFARRRSLLAELPEEPGSDGSAAEDVLARMDEGVPKLWVVRTALRLRRERPDAMAGSYRALHPRGDAADHVVAFVRGGDVVVVVPRLVLTLGPGFGSWDWAGTLLDLPAGRWRDRLSGRRLTGGPTPPARLLSRFPVALLTRE